ADVDPLVDRRPAEVHAHRSRRRRQLLERPRRGVMRTGPGGGGSSWSDRVAVSFSRTSASRQAVAAPISEVQNAQRRAGTGTSLRHSGHCLVCSSTGGSVFLRTSNAFTGLTTRKKITAAITRNEISALMNAP